MSINVALVLADFQTAKSYIEKSLSYIFGSNNY